MGETHDTIPTTPSVEDVLTTEPARPVQTEPVQNPTTLPMAKGLPAGEARRQLMERLIKGVKNL